MDRQGFRDYLASRGLGEEGITASLALAERMDAFLARPGRPGSIAAARPEDAVDFASLLIEEGANTVDALVAAARYAWFSGNRRAYVALVETVDGGEVLNNLYEKLGRALGEEVRDEVFEGIDRPPLGTPNGGKPRLMQKVLERLERQVGQERCRALLADSLRTLPDEGYLEEKEHFQRAGSLDAYLEEKGRRFLSLLEKLKAEKRLYFAQEITDAVIDYVKAHPEIQQGVREGNVLYEAKIPYMAKEHLAAKDPRMRAYYYCHCPWVRESLRAGKAKVPPVFCACSAGFHKRPYEVILGQRLRAEVVESVLQGDPWCRFALHLPEDVRPAAAKKGRRR